MPSTGDADGKRAQRARQADRGGSIEGNGGPRSQSRTAPSLEWFAANLEPRAFAEVADIADEVAFMECLIGSAATTTNGGMTVQLQVLPAYVHDALDAVQRASQGVFLLRLYQVPWESFRQDTPAWAHLDGGGFDDGEGG